MLMYNLYLRAKKQVGFSTLIQNLNVAVGTAKRWEEKHEVPKEYYLDLSRLCGDTLDYSLLSYREKGQFFTQSDVAQHCVETIKLVLQKNNINFDDYIPLEPSAGAGAFLPYLPQNTIAFDIEPRHKEVHLQDFLMWKPDTGRYIVIGNPPFGLRGQQALRFINKSLEFADFCCFILPPLFNSDGKGSPKKRVNGRLLYTETCNPYYLYPDGSLVKVETIFQIWTRLDLGEKIEEHQTKIDGIQIYSLSNGGTPSTTRNKDKIGKCDFYLPSTCFGKETVRLYNNFDDLPQQRGYGLIVMNEGDKEKIASIAWPEIAFVSTNGAYNLRQSLILQAIQDKIFRQRNI